MDDFRSVDLASETLIDDVDTVDMVAPQTEAECSAVSLARAAFSAGNLFLEYHLLEALQDVRVSVVKNAVSSKDTISQIAPDYPPIDLYSPIEYENNGYEPEFGLRQSVIW